MNQYILQIRTHTYTHYPFEEISRDKKQTQSRIQLLFIYHPNTANMSIMATIQEVINYNTKQYLQW